MTKIVDVLSREPVRIYLYTVATAVLALLVAVGIVTANLLPVILGLVTAVLAIPTTETLRARVTPVDPVEK